MGQRLVIDIKGCDSKPLGCIYYHWNGYTDSSYSTTSEFLSAWENTDPNKEDLERFLECCKNLNYGMAYDGSKLPTNTVQMFKQHIDRNHGIFTIAADNKAYADMKSWAEALVEIDFSTNIIVNSTFGFYQSPQEYNDEMPDDMQLSKSDIAKLAKSKEQVDIYEIKDHYKITSEVSYMPYTFINKDGSLLVKIA